MWAAYITCPLHIGARLCWESPILGLPRECPQGPPYWLAHVGPAESHAFLGSHEGFLWASPTFHTSNVINSGKK